MEYEIAYLHKEPEEEVLNFPPAELGKVKAFGSGRGRENLLIAGDNLGVLKALVNMKGEGRLRNSDSSAGARLIYIDPPFSTNLEFRGKKDQKAYKDKIIGAEFLEFLRKRLILMRELLADNGSIYLHLDWKKAHYVKAIMDEVFGEENFLNDIIWSYGGRGAKAIAGQFSRNHDIILWYQKSSHIFNQQLIHKRIRKGEAGFKRDGEGRWFKTSPRGDYTDESIKGLRSAGRIHRTKNGNLRIKYFLKEDGDYLIEDKLVGDVWDDIPDAMHLSDSEKTGYPTQKPEGLLARIIKASTNEGDIVLDAFAGAGTALAVAEKLGRRWIGIDSGRLSIHTIENRLLNLKGTKDLSKPDKEYYSARLRPFAAFEAHDNCLAHENGLKVRSNYSFDQKKGECVIKIKGVSGPDLNGQGLEALSSVMLDFSFNGEVFRCERAYSTEELKRNRYEVRFPAEMVKDEIMVIYSDIFGNEKWYLGKVE
ncbi:MAG: site-specific DNA-methyltransferase [Deltaproteobacteria bacterium]|nr:site-specific DNA-methyltransferase [Deltaproteobacteria bacterium]